MDREWISPETLALVMEMVEKKMVCQATNLSYQENRLVHCTLLADHVEAGTEHWGVEVNGVERGWDV